MKTAFTYSLERWSEKELLSDLEVGKIILDLLKFHPFPLDQCRLKKSYMKCFYGKSIKGYYGVILSTFFFKFDMKLIGIVES